MPKLALRPFLECEGYTCVTLAYTWLLPAVVGLLLGLLLPRLGREPSRPVIQLADEFFVCALLVFLVLEVFWRACPLYAVGGSLGLVTDRQHSTYLVDSLSLLVTDTTVFQLSALTLFFGLFSLCALVAVLGPFSADIRVVKFFFAAYLLVLTWAFVPLCAAPHELLACLELLCLVFTYALLVLVSPHTPARPRGHPRRFTLEGLSPRHASV
jgi:hypothetical protein